MIRGTTPTLTFTLPIQADTITLLNIAFLSVEELCLKRGLLR